MYNRKVDVDMLNAVKSVLANVSCVGPSSEQRVVKRLSDLWKYHSILYRKLPGTQGIATVTIVFVVLSFCFLIIVNYLNLAL